MTSRQKQNKDTPITNRMECRFSSLCAEEDAYWVPASITRSLERCLFSALNSFKITQFPADYPEDHWTRKAEVLFKKIGYIDKDY